MGYLRHVPRSKLFNEFTLEEQQKYFNVAMKKFIPHVDTLYYTVSIKGDCKAPKDYNVNNEVKLPDGMYDFIEALYYFKSQFNEYGEDFWFDEDKGLLFRRNNFARMYEFCIGKEGYYDIFIASSLPNNNTPRIVIQLRSIGLWTIGEYELIKESYDFVISLLLEYGLEIEKCQENRIDFCYHTNSIQNPKMFYGDDTLENHLSTTLTLGSKSFDIINKGDKNSIDYSYLSLGMRTSNNIFFRSYNKVREVIEKGYKGFFIEFWYNSKLISYYDYYVYTYAISKGRVYDYIYLGMLEFYLEFGQDPVIKDKFLALKNAKSFSLVNVKKVVPLYCPMPTLIINIEYQCMRKFFYSFDRCYEFRPIDRECGYYPLLKLFQLLDNRKDFLMYLTSYTVSFKKKINLPVRDSKGHYDEGIYLDFWKRLRSVKLDSVIKMPFYREYTRKTNKELLVSRLKGIIATLSLYDDNWDTDINEDMSNAICILNDNDVVQNEDGTCSIVDNEYSKMKEKRKKALKSILKPSRPSKSLNK